MKLYRKTLTSLDELEREKIRLRYERKGTKAKHLLPDIRKAKKKIIGGGKSKTAGEGNNILGIALGLLNGGSPIQTAISLAGPVMGLLSKGKNSAAPKRFLGRIVKDIVVSYVVGKGIQLALKGAKAYVRSRKAKQVEAKANAAMQKVAATR